MKVSSGLEQPAAVDRRRAALSGLTAALASAGAFGVATLAGGPVLALAWIAIAGAGASVAHRLLVPEDRQKRALVGWLQSMGRGAPVPRLDPGVVGTLAEDLNALAAAQSARDAALARLEEPLRRVPQGFTLARAAIDRSHERIEESVEETASLMANINNSIRDIAGEVESLLRAIEEASASTLQLGGAIDEVARSTGSLHDSVDASSSSVHEISASIRQVAESADAVQGMAEESAAAMVEMDRAIHEVSQHAAEASDLTEQVSQGANAGHQSVSSTVDDIGEIRERTQAAKSVLERLAERIGEIGEIVDVIGSINDETNLLSLNAAIIAAQAGEQGKPFAVVANHVKTLAQRTASSTKEIEALIRAVQKESANAVEAMGAGMEAVEAGVVRSRAAGQELLRIRGSAKEASARVADIARATVEQTRNSKHVAEAAQRTSSMVQQISTAMAEQARASEALLCNAASALELCQQVHRSTDEQRESTRFVTASISSIDEMVRQIRRNTESHAGASEAVAQVVGRILEATRSAGRELPEVMEALDRLRTEAETLLPGGAGEAQQPDPVANRPSASPAMTQPA